MAKDLDPEKLKQYRKEFKNWLPMNYLGLEDFGES